MGSTVTDTFEMFDSSIVSDALDRHGIDGVVNSVSPAHPDQTAVGRAHTLRFELAETTGEDTNFPYAMLNELLADRVLVIDGAGPEISCWGGNASRLAANAGVNGIVVDGGFRDVGEIRNGSFPVFGAAPTPRTGQRRVTIEAVGEPIEIDGVTVAPEDVVVADATGVVVVPADEAAAVADTAEAILEEELLVEAKIENGALVEDLQGDGHDF